MGWLKQAVASEIVGLPVAVFLILLSFVLLPSGQRRRVRQPIVLLVLSLGCSAARAVVEHDGADRVLLFFANFTLLASIGRSLVLIVLDVFVARRRATGMPGILRDLATAVVYLVVALMTLRSIGVEPGSILTTSALLTAVVGFALQDTLGNLASGLALQMQPPFEVGDWIELDGGAVGRVTAVNWRAVHVMTKDHVEVILPNASLAKSSIRNHSRPSKVCRRRVTVGVSYAAAPDEVHAVLIAAAREVPGVRRDPLPRARSRAFADSGIDHEVLFFIDDFEQAENIECEVRDRIYYSLARRGFEIPYPHRTVLIPRRSEAATTANALARRQAAIAEVEFLAALPEDSRRLLSERSELRRYGTDEPVVRKGERTTELFIIESGEVAVELSDDAVVNVLGPGQCFGEMALLTGEARRATVRAKTVCHLVVIGHDAFHDVLAAHPEVIDNLSSLLAARQAELRAASEKQEPGVPASDRKKRLIAQIRDFFQLS